MKERRRGDRRQRGRRSEPEHVEQASLFRWTQLHEHRIPELRWLYAVPNGRYRAISEAVKLKLEGVRPGVPDVALDVAMGEYHGFRLEMKAPGKKNQRSEIQKAWHEWLAGQGYKVVTCSSWQEAWNELVTYLGHKNLVLPI